MAEGETPAETALREIREELSVSLDPKRLSLLQKHYISEQNLTTWVFLYPINGELDNAVLSEGQEWDFIGQSDPRAAEIGLHHKEIVRSFWDAP